MTVPTLSEVQSYDPVWLTQAAQHNTTAGQAFTDTWSAAVRSVSAANWWGNTRNTAVQSHESDQRQAQIHTQDLEAVAQIAKQGYTQLTNERDTLLQQVTQIQDEDYQVSEAFTVSPPPNMSPLEATVKAPEILRMTAMLQEGAANLVAHDVAVDGQIAAAIANPTGIPTHTPKPAAPPMDTPGNGTPQLADYHTGDNPTPNVGPFPVAAVAPPNPNPGLDQYLGSLGAAPLPAGAGQSMPAGASASLPPLPAYDGKPLMRAGDPTKPPYSVEPDTPYDEKNVDAGMLAASAVAGCGGGAGLFGLGGAAFPPAEPGMVAAGCVVGGVSASEGYLLNIAVQNIVHGNG